MLAREDAVSAVSLPAKNADSSRHTNTTTSESQSFAVICLRIRVLIRQKGAHVGGIDVVFDERLADAAHQNEGELAALHFLVLGDQIHQRSAAGMSPGTSLIWVGRPTAAR